MARDAPRSSVPPRGAGWPPRHIKPCVSRGFFVMNYSVYILFSKITKRYYTGQTQDIDNRMSEHNSGETTSIKNGIPWELVWVKEVESRSDAVLLESKIKKRGAERFLSDQ